MPHTLPMHVYRQFTSTRDELKVFYSLTLTEFFEYLPEYSFCIWAKSLFEKVLRLKGNLPGIKCLLLSIECRFRVGRKLAPRESSNALLQGYISRK